MNSFASLVPSARGLLVFEAAVRSGSFTAAAREFNVTQPSVSRSIAQLEADLGAVLFTRGRTGLTPTAEGRLLYSAVRDGFDRIEEAVLVPLGALFRRGAAWAVFVVAEDGRAVERTVQIGARTSQQAVVEAGLEPGDRVILHPSDRVTEGQPVAERQD
jgi:DNA-binding transcriptional LysR family regulator